MRVGPTTDGLRGFAYEGPTCVGANVDCPTKARGKPIMGRPNGNNTFRQAVVCWLVLWLVSERRVSPAQAARASLYMNLSGFKIRLGFQNTSLIQPYFEAERFMYSAAHTAGAGKTRRFETSS